MRKILKVVFKVLFAIIAAVVLLATFTLSFAGTNQNGMEFLWGTWAYQDGPKENPPTITFNPDGLGTSGFRSLYTDIESLGRNELDGEIVHFLVREGNFFYAVTGSDILTDGKGNMLEYIIVDLWFPSEKKIITINILPVNEKEIVIFKKVGGKKYTFVRPEPEI